MRNPDRNWRNRAARRREIAEGVAFVLIPILCLVALFSIIWALVETYG